MISFIDHLFFSKAAAAATAGDAHHRVEVIYELL
jgi:hypothetical protein